MNTCTTHGITINVLSKFEQEHSNVRESRYVFSYLIEIVNDSDVTVQLLKRHWHIIDSNCIKREVQGEGVVGEQPTLQPGEKFRYSSWCPFSSEIGMMKGFYSMRKSSNGEIIEVKVPPFTMCVLSRLN